MTEKQFRALLSIPTNTMSLLTGIFGMASLLVAVGTLMAAPACATERNFTYTYETTTPPKGVFEIEQWATWKTHVSEEPGLDRFEFRHEIEYGITDRWEAALYVSDWSYQRGGEEENGARWQDVALETIFNLSDPSADPIGSALYGEVRQGDEISELEGKLLLQKNFARTIVAYNAAVEAEWEGRDFGERNGEFQQSAGLSYQIMPAVTGGVELLHEVEFEDWRDAQKAFVGIGPVLSLRQGRWWTTVTTLLQATNTRGEPDLQTRLIFGVNL